MKTSDDVALRLLAEAKTRAADPRAIWGIPWGFHGLDALTGGIQREEMSVVMARPGVGKTSFMEQVTTNVADWMNTPDGYSYLDKHTEGRGVIRLVLLEMTAENFQQRLTCKRAGVSTRAVREGKLTPEEFARYENEAFAVAQLPIEYLDSTNGLEMTARFLSQREHPTLWWGLDYLQIHPTGQRGQVGDVAAINLISTTLRDIAKQVAPGLVLSQMTREVDKRTDKRPQMADLRGSGQLEADASLIGGLYRADIYERVTPEEMDKPKLAEFVLIKQRNGPTNRTVDFKWHPKEMRFEDISEYLAQD